VTSASPAPVRQRWLIPALIVVLSLTIGGGLLAREVYKQPPADQPAGVVAAAPTSSSLSAAEEPGPSTVLLTPDAADHPQGAALRAMFQAYFDSINQREYALWTTTVTVKRRQQKTEQDWRKGNQSTRDGSITIYRIETAPDDTLRVLLGFTSTQNPEDAPAELKASCIRWRPVWSVVPENNAWKLDVAGTGNTLDMDAC
jgi:hypothetical protein